jgi:hypothetical protein
MSTTFHQKTRAVNRLAFAPLNTLPSQAPTSRQDSEPASLGSARLGEPFELQLICVRSYRSVVRMLQSLSHGV